MNRRSEPSFGGTGQKNTWFSDISTVLRSTQWWISTCPSAKPSVLLSPLCQIARGSTHDSPRGLITHEPLPLGVGLLHEYIFHGGLGDFRIFLSRRIGGLPALAVGAVGNGIASIDDLAGISFLLVGRAAEDFNFAADIAEQGPLANAFLLAVDGRADPCWPLDPGVRAFACGVYIAANQAVVVVIFVQQPRQRKGLLILAQTAAWA